MFTQNELLKKWIPYRLEAINTLRWAWALSEAKSGSRVQVLIEGRSQLEGGIAAITNPMIEAGFIHARALLEFLGLRATRDGKLSVITHRKKGDIAIENFSTPSVTLTKASLASVAAAYPGPGMEAEESLVALLQISNRWLAHVTDGVLSKDWTDRHIDIALRGMPVLIRNHLYAPLGFELPQIGNLEVR